MHDAMSLMMALGTTRGLLGQIPAEIGQVAEVKPGLALIAASVLQEDFLG